MRKLDCNKTDRPLMFPIPYGRQPNGGRCRLAATTAALLIAGLMAHTSYAQDLFLTTATITIDNADYKDASIYIGLDANRNQTDPNTNQPYVATANFVAGAVVRSTLAYNANTMNISGGNLLFVGGLDDSTVNVNGGTITHLSGGISNTFAPLPDSSMTLNIAAGKITNADIYANSVANISGGIIDSIGVARSGVLNISAGTMNTIRGYDTSTINVSGGDLVDGAFLFGTTTMNFDGTDLSFVYGGFDNTPAVHNADLFTITGIIGGSRHSYNLYIVGNQASRTPNDTPRQFTFNGLSVVVPEAGTLAFVLPVLLMVGTVVQCRRTKQG